MKTVGRIFDAEFEVKGSKFLAFLVPAAKFEAEYERLRHAHPKASHLVWANRKVNVHGQTVEASSDDGEPKGCAGRPVLNVMRGNNLIECGVVVVRYFGGIKLGTGGMARAYAEAAKEAVACAELVPYERVFHLTFHTPYSELPKWESFIHALDDIRVVKNYEDDGVEWCLSVPASIFDTLQRRLHESHIKFSIE